MSDVQPIADLSERSGEEAAHGSGARCAARIAEYRAAGVDLPVVFPMPIGTDWGYEQTIATLGGATVEGDGEAGGVASAGLAAR